MTKKIATNARNTTKRQLESLYRSGKVRREDEQVTPGEDGVTHINVAMTGESELGIMLGFDFRAPFILKGLGSFLTLEGFCRFTESETDNPIFQRLDMFEAQRVAQGLPRRDHVANYNVIVMDAMYQRIKQFSDLAQKVKDSTLPFEMYMIRDGQRQRLSMAWWVIAGLDHIRECLKSGEEPNFWPWLRHNRNDTGAGRGGNTIASLLSKRMGRKEQIHFVKHCIAQRFPQVLQEGLKDPEPILLVTSPEQTRKKAPKANKPKAKDQQPKQDSILIRRRVIPAYSEAFKDLVVDETKFKKRSYLLTQGLVVESLPIRFLTMTDGWLKVAVTPLMAMMRANKLVAESGFVNNFVKMRPWFMVPTVALTIYSGPGAGENIYGRYDVKNKALIVNRAHNYVDVFPLNIEIKADTGEDFQVSCAVLNEQEQIDTSSFTIESLGLREGTTMKVHKFETKGAPTGIFLEVPNATLHNVEGEQGTTHVISYVDANGLIIYVDLVGIEVDMHGMFRPAEEKKEPVKLSKPKKINLAEANPTGAPDPVELPFVAPQVDPTDEIRQVAEEGVALGLVPVQELVCPDLSINDELQKAGVPAEAIEKLEQQVIAEETQQ